MALITICAVTCRFNRLTNKSSRIDLILSDLEDTLTTIPFLEPDVTTHSSDVKSSAAPISGYESMRSASRYINLTLLRPANALIDRFWLDLIHLFCKYLFCCNSSILALYSAGSSVLYTTSLGCGVGCVLAIPLDTFHAPLNIFDIFWNVVYNLFAIITLLFI